MDNKTTWVGWWDAVWRNMQSVEWVKRAGSVVKEVTWCGEGSDVMGCQCVGWLWMGVVARPDRSQLDASG